MAFFNKLFKKKYTLNAILDGIEKGSNFAVTQEPIKTFSTQYFNEKSFPKVIQEEYQNFANELALRPSYNSQKNYFIAHLFRQRLDLQIYAKSQTKEEALRNVWLVYLAETDPPIKEILDYEYSDDLSEEDLSVVFKKMSHLALLRWVRLLGTQALLTHFGLTLFGRSPAEDEYQRKFEILIDQHLNKLMAELLLGGVDFGGVRGVYDCDEVKPDLISYIDIAML